MTTDALRRALAGPTVARPDEPFLFFRSPRGTFTWWSFERALRALDETPRPDDGSSVPVELLAALRRTSEREQEAARALAARVAPAPTRQVWLSSRPLERLEERLLALAALFGSWALVREPVDGTPAAALLWARPTVVSGSAAELAALVDAIEAEAPRFRRAHWLAARLGRIATILVEGEGEERSAVTAGRLVELRRAGPPPAVLSFPEIGW